MEQKSKKDKKEKTPPPSFSFKYLLKSRPGFSKVLLTSSPLTSCLGLGAFTESTRLGTISCTKTEGSLKTTISIATVYHSSQILYINSNEKLRPGFAIDFAESLVAEGLLKDEIVVFDSICESEYFGDLRSRVKSVHLSGSESSTLRVLEPGNNLKGVVAAVVIVGKVHGLNVRCVVGVPESYELSVENVRIFQEATDELSLNVNWLNGIHRFEEEKFKHQIYS